jgi:hypothetical protein
VSIANVGPTLRSFLASSNPEVIALKGGWGTGKTFFWKKELSKAAEESRLGVTRYAYVSLFGLSSLEQLKQAIFANSLPAQSISDGQNLSTFSTNIQDVLKRLEGTSGNIDIQASKSLFKNLAEKILRTTAGAASGLQWSRAWLPFMADATFFVVRNQLICLDDFERVGRGLDARDILGLVSLLKEQRGCKIALIFNEASIRDEHCQQYAEYREKVVDIEVEFAPSVEEAVDIVFDENDLRRNLILKYAKSLKLTNIRLLQRIKRVLKIVEMYLQNVEPSVAENVIGTVVLYVWSFYTRDGTAPPLEFLKTTGYVKLVAAQIGKGKNDKGATEGEEWRELLQSYGYTHTDELDLSIAQLIERGYPDPIELPKRLADINAQHKAQLGKSLFDGVWDTLWGSLEDDEDKLVPQLTTIFKHTSQYLSVNDLNQSVGILRELGHDAEADTLIESYVDAHKQKPEVFKLDRTWMIGPLDPKIEIRFLEARGITETPKQMREVVASIAERNSWAEEDIKFLAGKTDQEYFDFLKSVKSRDVYIYIKTLMGFQQIANANPDFGLVASRTRSALKRIAGESRINAFRLRNYGPFHDKEAGQSNG